MRSILTIFSLIVVSSLLIFTTTTDISDEDLLRNSFESKINRNRFYSEEEVDTQVDKVEGMFFDNKLKLVFPVKIDINTTVVETSKFNKKRINDNGKVYYHGGSDISHYDSWRGEIQGINIVAAISGNVMTVQRNPSVSTYGVYLKIQEPTTGIIFIYAHLKEGSIPNEIMKNYKVETGEHLGLMGTTGRSTGPHLHYEMRAPGVDNAHYSETNRGRIDPYDPTFFVYKGDTIPAGFKPLVTDLITY